MQSRGTPLFLVTAIGFMLLLAFDASGLDLVLAAPFATADGFPLRDHWLLSGVLHEGARRAAWLPALWIVAGIWMPTGFQRRLARDERVQWATATLLALLAISAFKQLSQTSCPWDLAQFGGSAQLVSHWAWGTGDGGPGRCFPAGHASAGFAFVAGWFVLRRRLPRVALIWLAVSVAAGLLLGLAQQMRGAHFMSHTLWTAWTCWVAGWLVDFAAQVARMSRAATAAIDPAHAPTVS